MPKIVFAKSCLFTVCVRSRSLLRCGRCFVTTSFFFMTEGRDKKSAEISCGFMRRDFSDKTLKYEVRSLEDLIYKIIPHFEKRPLISEKQNDFNHFKSVCLLMQRNLHKEKSGLKKILSHAFQMNPSGKRKYSKNDISNTLR